MYEPPKMKIDEGKPVSASMFKVAELLLELSAFISEMADDGETSVVSAKTALSLDYPHADIYRRMSSEVIVDTKLAGMKPVKTDRDGWRTYEMYLHGVRFTFTEWEMPDGDV